MKQCPQCWNPRPDENYIGKRGLPVNWCASCRSRIGPGGKYTRAEPRRNLRRDGEIRVLFKRTSGNKKTGPIPVSITSAETCPPSCSFFGKGCYAEFHMLRHHWARVPARGVRWGEFLDAVRALPPDTLWRHNEAGDLPGKGDRIDVDKMMALVEANRGRRGFTFTHKPMFGGVPTRGWVANRAAVLIANQRGLTINLSADSLDEADALADLAIGPVAVVLHRDAPIRLRTPAGRRVVLCPAETAGLTCATCQLCAHATRKAVVGFRAHGQMSGQVSQLVELRLRAP